MEDYHAEDVFSSELFKTGSKSGGCLHCFVGVFDSTRIKTMSNVRKPKARLSPKRVFGCRACDCVQLSFLLEYP